jgi:hypothetical protein
MPKQKKTCKLLAETAICLSKCLLKHEKANIMIANS